MKRNIKKTIKKAVVAVAAASMLTVLTAPLAVMPVSAATVTRGSYDFSNMVVRRVWFNTDDPVFLIDDYQRVWLDSNVNVLATGNATNPKPDTTVKLTIGSTDVEINGNVKTGALTDEQKPVKVNAKDTYADMNTYLTEDYNVVK